MKTIKNYLTLTFIAALVMGSLTSNAQSAGDYRTASSGSWTTTSIWESYNGASWVAAGHYPTFADGVISIRNGHSINVFGVTIDQTVIESGGLLTVPQGGVLNINDGPGTDLLGNSGGGLGMNSDATIN